MDLAEKYLGEAKEWDAEKVAFEHMESWLKDMKKKIIKAEKSIKNKNIDMNVTDMFMRMSKVNEQTFFDYFWS